MLVPWTSDAAYSLLHASGWSIGDTACMDSNSGRLVWLVYCHRGEQRVVAKTQSQTAAWNEAPRMAAEIDAEAAQPSPQRQWPEREPMRTPIEAQRRYSGPWKPAELTDELGDDAPVVIMTGSNEPLGVAVVFAIKADADCDPELIEAARAAGFTVVDA